MKKIFLVFAVMMLAGCEGQIAQKSDSTEFLLGVIALLLFFQLDQNKRTEVALIIFGSAIIYFIVKAIL